MIFIFGIAPREKVLGPCEEITCSRCHNKTFWMLKKSVNWISLFFIPVIPVSTKKFMYCSICGNHEPLTDEQFQKQEKKANLNRDALNKDYSFEVYQNHKNNL